MKRLLIAHKRKLLLFSYIGFIFVILLFSFSFSQADNEQVSTLGNEKERLTQELTSVQKSYEALKNQDQVKVNQQLKKDIDQINKTYKDSITIYEQMQDLKARKQDISQLEVQYASIVKNLSDLKYEAADKELQALTTEITKRNAALGSQPTMAKTADASSDPVQVNNTPPDSGFSVQQVESEVGTFSVNIISADLNSTRVVVDTASDSDCANDCPVLSLGDYVSRSGAYAGINGSYFCPASYPSCAGKTNSFDTLLMNKNKTYFNSDNNIYSTVPVVIFSAGNARFIGASSGWGRDTSVDSVIANQPLLLSGGNVVFGGDGDPKKGSKGPRSFVGSKGSTVYIGVVNGATVAEAAYVLKALGMENALNLDSGGSTALWHGGYKVGPGRNIPNAVLFIRR